MNNNYELFLITDSWVNLLLKIEDHANGRFIHDTVFKVIHDINLALNSGNTLGAIFIDFKKFEYHQPA